MKRLTLFFNILFKHHNHAFLIYPSAKKFFICWEMTDRQCEEENKVRHTLILPRRLQSKIVS